MPGLREKFLILDHTQPYTCGCESSKYNMIRNTKHLQPHYISSVVQENPAGQTARENYCNYRATKCGLATLIQAPSAVLDVRTEQWCKRLVVDLQFPLHLGGFPRG